MRTDPTLPLKSFRKSDQWTFDVVSGRRRDEIDRRYGSGESIEGDKHLDHSFSGHERNHLFLSDRGQNFSDISAISGLDNIADSRAFVLWDYNRDGWQDIALVNANTPLLNLYRNNIHEVSPISRSRAPPVIAIRFVGGNHTAKPSAKFSSRDGYGAVVRVVLGEVTITREHRCGEGFAAQNSATLLIGIGDASGAASVSVRWPRGTTHTIDDVPAGSLVVAYENPRDAPDELPLHVGPYQPIATEAGPRTNSRQPMLKLDLAGTDKSLPAELRMFTTMATWCEACHRHLPQLARLRTAFSGEQLAMFGVPADALETSKQLAEYVRKNKPGYRLLTEITSGERSKVQTILSARLGAEPLPSTIITDASGTVLKVLTGVPTVSDLGKLMEEVK